MAKAMATGSPSLMRQLNLTSVLSVIRAQGPLPRPELARATGLSMPTVKQLVDLLMAKGYVEEVDPPVGTSAPRRPGPRARFVSFRATLGYVLALDVGAHNTVAKLADLSGSVISTVRVVHPEPADRPAVLHAIRTSVGRVYADSGVQPHDVRAMVIGTPGVVDPRTGEVTLAPQIANWDGIDLKSELSDIIHFPTVVENEAHLSLLAEQWIGAAHDHLNVVYIQLGIGIGAAILIDGRLYRGSSGAAGEIAYLVTDADVDQPRDSAAGPFEWFAGGDAFRRRGAMAAIGARGATLLSMAGGDPDAVTAQIVIDAAAAGDAAASDVATSILERLGREVANIASILNPDLILLGGGIANAGDMVLRPIREAVERFAPRPPPVHLSGLGGDGAVLGAVRRAVDIADEATFSFIGTTESYREEASS